MAIGLMGYRRNIHPEDTVFHRIFVQGNASPFITYSPDKPLPRDGDDPITSAASRTALQSA